MPRYVLGLDSSTQSLSGVLLDLDSHELAGSWSINFDEAFPSYGTRHGVLPADDPCVVHSPPLLWVEALDMIFAAMVDDQAPLGEVCALSGSGQQHGSVYLNSTAEATLAGLDPAKSLKENLQHIFSRPTSPVWMDSSTSTECREITIALGGDTAVAEATGSIAFERFTGSQIRKFFKDEPDCYRQTAEIALVSSFMASILGGCIAPIDHADCAGMNLMDIRSRDWHDEALAATAPDLARRLRQPVPSWQVAGNVSSYFVSRYGVSSEAINVVWSGDNPNSLVGLGLVRPGDWAISLGTSDTLFGLMKKCQVNTDGEGHVFVSPTGDYMSLICFKNGSLAREQIKDAYGLDWPGFADAITSTPKGNDGKIILPYFEPEIVPKVLVPGIHRFGLAEDDAAGNCRAVVEAQMLSMRIHSSWMGQEPTRIFATGGASSNDAILQVMADVHQVPVVRISVDNSAALGAALRAAHAWYRNDGDGRDWSSVVEPVLSGMCGETISPDSDAAGLYDSMAEAYAEREKLVRDGGQE